MSTEQGDGTPGSGGRTQPKKAPARFREQDVPHPLSRLWRAILLLAAVVLIGALGYHHLGRSGYLDSFYMSVTTLFTVGFRELGEVNDVTKLFTIFYLVTGLGIATYALSSLTALIVEGDLRGYLKERRMEKRLAALSEHIIICGLGKVGFQAAWEFKQAGVPFVIVEKIPTKSGNLRFEGDPIVIGDALDELVLERVGIHRARGLVAAVGSDADNVLVTLTAKQMAPDLVVVARAARLGTEKKLKAAGADHIVSPYEIGGRRMAQLLIAPDLLNYVDLMVDKKPVEMAIEHILVNPASGLVGCTMRETRLRDTTGALVAGIIRPGEGLHFNPRGSETFEPGDVILAMGTHRALEDLKALAHGKPSPA
ncbi:MAG TPA: potassium channel protein [Holophaga sp.]|nr:potassium channel protein [Holophaga sp.]HPS68231.1 potassium channel protein [Holophaga sp.]